MSEGDAGWLDEHQQRSWRALVSARPSFDRLDDDLRRTYDISLVEYEILVRLSERDGQMRMARWPTRWRTAAAGSPTR